MSTQPIGTREGLQQLLDLSEVCENLDCEDGNTDGTFVPVSIDVFLQRIRAATATLDLARSTLRVIAARIDDASGSPTFTDTDRADLQALIEQLQGGAA